MSQWTHANRLFIRVNSLTNWVRSYYRTIKTWPWDSYLTDWETIFYQHQTNFDILKFRVTQYLDLSIRLWVINPTNSPVIPQGLVLRSIENWPITIAKFNKL